jgi:DnaJ like chaperone protein
MSKWIGASIGWAFLGPIGGILGLVLGSMFDPVSKKKSSSFYPRTKSGDFEISLLVLSAVVIKADGIKDKRELDYVRSHFIRMYGRTRANNAFKLFKKLNNLSEIPTRKVCLQIRSMMDHPSRLQLLHFLFGVAQADGIVLESEVIMINKIATYLGINISDFESIKAMFYKDIDSAYRILEIRSTVSDQEIKNAYRRMAKKYHPDKVAHLGVEHQKGAEEKFKKVQEAYILIKKRRGL